MGRKILGLKEAKNYIEQQGYVLLSEEYKNAHTKLDVQCSKEHQYQVTWANFQQGSRCPYCARKRISHQTVRECVENRGYVLLSKYKKCKGPLDIQCSKGHQYCTSWNRFQRGQKCPICTGAILTYNQVRLCVKKQGHTLLSKKYNNAHTKLLILCDEGHQYRITWSNFKQKRRCPECNKRDKRHDYSQIKNAFLAEGYTLLSKRYVNNHTYLYVQCNNGHRYKTTWATFQQGHRCPKCAGRVISFDQIKKYVESQEYTLLSEKYENSKSKLKVQCNKKHTYKVRWNDFQQGYRCPYCLNKSEHKLGEILEQLYPGRIKKQGNLGFLGRQRVDYYIEEEKIAIEYDGIQHHKPIVGAFGAKTKKEAEQRLKEIQQRDKRKEQLCKENDWRLIRIRYDEPLSIEYAEEKIRGKNTRILQISPQNKRRRRGRTTKFSVDYIRQQFEQANLVPLFSQYKNNKIKLPYQCRRCGVYHQVAWDKFKKNPGCTQCKRKQGVNKRRISHIQILQMVRQEGYAEVDMQQVQARQNNRSKFTLKCPKGHQFDTCWNYWQKGHRCPKCRLNKTIAKQKNKIRQKVGQCKYVIVDISNYLNCASKFTLKCSKGHQFDTCWNYWQKGHRCPKCAGKAITYRQIKNYIEQQGYILLSKQYTNAHTKLNVQCSRKHTYKVRWNDFQQGYRCPYCLHKSEHKLGQILEQIFPNKIKKQGNLGFLGRQRVDYYIEQEKIAIEYDGEQHHKPIIGAFGAKTEEEAQEQLRETQQRDKRKEQLCKKNGWRLIRVGYDEPLSIEYAEEKIQGKNTRILQIAQYYKNLSKDKR